MHHRVLVLNRLWQAVHICSVNRAMSLVYTGHAQIVHEDETGFNTFSFNEWCDFSQGHHANDDLRTISLRVRIPRVIVLLFFDRFPKKDIKFTRNNVFERDKNTCQYCSNRFERKDLNIDHVVPRQKGGSTTWTNVVCSCIRCNRIKANRTPEEAGMRLHRKPKKPHWRPFIELSITRPPEKSWRHFIDLAYWNVELGED